MVGASSSRKGQEEERIAFAGEHPEILEHLRLAVPIDTTTMIQGLRLRAGGDAGIALYGAPPILELWVNPIPS